MEKEKKKIKTKFFRPGTLEVSGTKISLKTQPYINGVIFNVDDPISSFRLYLSTMKLIVDEYEKLREVPGINKCVPTNIDISSGITGEVKLLLNYLIVSPTEVILKEQHVDNDILQDLEAQRIHEE